MACDLECGRMIAIYISGACVILTLIISIYQVAKHMKHFTNPHFQGRTIVIILMAPFYAITSFGTIVTRDTTGYWDLVRDIYEAILIYTFFNLLASYVGYDDTTKEIDYDKIYEALSYKGITKHIFPVNLFLKPLVLISRIRGEWYFKHSKIMILQYLVLKPFTSFCLIIVNLIDSDSPAKMVFNGIAGLSVFVSVYYLVLFYHTLHAEMAHEKPLMKFLSVKGVLFFTFWQNFVVEIVVDKVSDAPKETKTFIVTDLENMLVCIEMVILTIMTTIAFSYNRFKIAQGLRKKHGIMSLTKRLVDDVFADGLSNAVKDLGDLKAPLKLPFKQKYKDNAQETHLMSLSSKIDRKVLAQVDLDEECQARVIEQFVITPGFYQDGREPPSPARNIPAKIKNGDL